MTLATPVLTAILISYCTQQRSAVTSKPAASHVNFNVTTAVIVILQFCDNKLMNDDYANNILQYKILASSWLQRKHVTVEISNC